MAEPGLKSNETTGVRLKLHPTTVPEWDRRDNAYSVLGGEKLQRASPEAEKRMLEETELTLPTVPVWSVLADFSKSASTPFGIEVMPEKKDRQYIYMKLSLGIMPGKKARIVHLRLFLDLEAEGGAGDVIAYDLFPRNEVETKEIMSGKASIDITKALKFIPLAIPASGPIVSALADSFGMKLDAPLSWSSTEIVLNAAGLQSSHIVWEVDDRAMKGQFTAYAIIQAPQKATIRMKACVVGEVREIGLLGKVKSVFKSQVESDPKLYTYPEA